MYEIIANLLKESKKTTVITGDGISIDSQKIDYKTSVDNQVYNGITYQNYVIRILINQIIILYLTIEIYVNKYH